MECKDCGDKLYRINGLCTDPQGIREDAYCADCNIRYMVTKSSLVKISQGVNEADVTIENERLKITIKTMMQLKEES